MWQIKKPWTLNLVSMTNLCVNVQVQKYKAIAEKKQKNGTEETGSTDEDDLQNGLDPHILDLQSKKRF